MLSGCVVFVCVAAVVVHGVGAQAAAPCSSADSRTMEFSVTSHRDRTGHWVAQVDLEHGADDQESGAWKADIQHNTVGCPGSPKVKLTVKLTAPPLKPGPGYELRRGVGYYKLHAEKKTWPEAKSICESEGAHLAIINSEEEAEFLRNMYLRIPAKDADRWAYVGFHDLYTEGQHVTIFDEPLNTTGFTRWHDSNQPDNYAGSATTPGEDCGSLSRENGGLNDLTCSRVVPFLCELELA